eukprot:15453915-Alexandrium_andersonii.AAC.1
MVHGHSNKASDFAFGVTCACCLYCFHVRARFLQHLRYGSPRCLERIRLNMSLPSEDHVRD